MTRITRRTFLGSAAALAAASACSNRILGANGDIRAAIVGVGRRGNELVDVFKQIAGVRIVALCDPDAEHLAACAAQHFDGKVDTYSDLRRVLDRGDVDVIVGATPDHWHALLTIWACQAGKDVYIEKPVSHDPFEGRIMVEAARRHGRIVQGGFQNRSDPGLRDAFDWLARGSLGKLKLVRGVHSRARHSIGARASVPLAPPPSLDYDLWLGPAAAEPILRPTFHHDWHWIWNYGAGDIGNHGPHVLDMCRWALGDPPAPRSVQSFGARFAWNDAGETANMQVALFDYALAPVVMEVHALAADPATKETDKIRGLDTGVILEYEHGEFRGDRGGGAVFDSKGKTLRDFPGDGGLGHAQNFIDAVRSRNRVSLFSPIEEAHHSSSLAHLANASLRAGAQIKGSSLADSFEIDGTVAEILTRFRGNLRAWKVDDDVSRWNVGARLEFDAATERFKSGPGFEEANLHLRRACRAGFVVPEHA